MAQSRHEHTVVFKQITPTVNPSSRRACWHCPNCLGSRLRSLILGTQEDVYLGQTDGWKTKKRGKRTRMNGKQWREIHRGDAGCGNRDALGVKKKGRMLSIFRCTKHKMEGHYSSSPPPPPPSFSSPSLPTFLLGTCNRHSGRVCVP